jgi:prevent-host-death family protein
MEQITIQIFTQDIARVLARVEHGEVVEITDRGRPIARIVPISTDPLADLTADGTVTPPTVFAPFTMPSVASGRGTDVGE